MKRIAGALLIGVLAGGSLGGVLGLRAYGRWRAEDQRRAELVQRRASWERLKQAAWSEIRSFHGESAVWIEDLDTGWVAAYQEDKPFPAASVVKVPILLTCFAAAAEGEMSLEEPMVLQGRDKVNGSGVLKSMPNGTQITTARLLDLMVTRSDNTATNLLISRLGMDNLNRSFLEMGLTGTQLSRVMMDFSRRKNGVENWTTARDVSHVFRKIYRAEGVSPAVSQACLDLLKRQEVRDRLPALLPPGTVVAHKTGLEKGVCHDSGILFTEKGAVMVCVLTRNGGKAKPAKGFISRIAARAYDYLGEDYGG